MKASDHIKSSSTHNTSRLPDTIQMIEMSWKRLSHTHIVNSVEITNKMLPCIRIYYSTVH